MAVEIIDMTTPAGVPRTYSRIEKIAIDKNGSLTLGLAHFIDLEARKANKPPINAGNLDVVSSNLTDEEKQTVFQIFYAALSRHPDYVDATKIDPDYWKTAEEEGEDHG